MTIQQAKDFIHYNIKEGVYSPEDFEKMTDSEIVIFSERENARAEYYANLKEEEV